MAGLATDAAFRRSVTAVIDAVAEAVERIDVPNGGGFDHRTLDAVERAAAAYLREHRRLLDRLAPRIGRRRTWRIADDEDRAAVLPFIRVAIGVADVLWLAVVQVRPDVGDAWGAHLFKASDIDLVAFTSLELRGLTARAATLLLPEVAADLADGLADIATHGGFWDESQVSATRTTLDRACQHLVGVGIGATLRVVLLTEQQFADALRWTTVQVREARDLRHVVSVLSWSGEIRYPDFQEFRGALNPLVPAIAPHVVSTFDGWPLALWLRDQVNAGRTASQAQAELEALSAALENAGRRAPRASHEKNGDAGAGPKLPHRQSGDALRSHGCDTAEPHRPRPVAHRVIDLRTRRLALRLRRRATAVPEAAVLPPTIPRRGHPLGVTMRAARQTRYPSR